MKIMKLIEGLEVLIEVSGRQPQSGNLRPKMSAEVSNYQHNANIQDQIVQEFRGLAEGVMADGVLNDSEIEYLRKWSLKRREFLKGFPLSQFFSVISKNNTDEIKSFLTEMVFDEYSDQVHLKSIFDVVDKIDFHDRWFCFTGEFAEKDRMELFYIVESKGGLVSDSLLKCINILVVGSKGSEAWKFGNYGRKLEKAINLRADGANIKIIDEETFLKNI